VRCESLQVAAVLVADFQAELRTAAARKRVIRRTPKLQDSSQVRRGTLLPHRALSHISFFMYALKNPFYPRILCLISTPRLLRQSFVFRSFFMRRESLSGTAQPRSAKATKLSHQERTATEPRERDLYTATVAKVTPVNDRIKTFRFNLKDTNGFNVLPATPSHPTHADG
jgi:hypothetical protein